MEMQRVIGISLMSRIFLRDWLRWRCRMQKNLLKFLGWPKTRGNNMKTPFLSSFCLSDLRTVHRFPPKNLVPEILNLLTLVVHNCTLEICCLLTQCVAYLSDVLPSRFGECDDVGMYALRTLWGARFAIRVVWQLYITVLHRSIYSSH